MKTIVNKNHSLISENKSKSKDTKDKKYNKNEKDKKERKEDDLKEPKPKFKKINVESNANNRGNTRQVKYNQNIIKNIITESDYINNKNEKYK